MSPQEVDPFFIQQLKIVLEHWQEEATLQDKEVLSRLDNSRQNLFHIVNLGLEHSYTQTAAARLSLAVFLLVERRGYWVEWIPVLEQAIDLNGEQPSSLMFDLYNRLGQLYRWDRRIKDAIKAHQSAEGVAQQLSDDFFLANAWANLSEDYNQIRRFDESEKFGLLALEKFEELAVDKKWSATVYNSLGMNAMNRGQLETAEARLSQAVVLFRQLDDSVRLARVIYNLANLLRATKRFEEALILYEEAADILGDETRTHDLVAVHIALGGVNYDLGRLSAAESAFRKALSPDSSNLGYTYYQAFALQGLGNVLLKMERYEEAEPLLENAITYWQKLDAELYLVNSLGTLAETAVAKHDLPRAVGLYERAIFILKENHQNDPYGQRLLTELTGQLQALLNSPPEGGGT
ncbi:MAG: tetratricopeptide repeat protein [Candidatus Promineifilaceae bacterium]